MSHERFQARDTGADDAGADLDNRPVEGRDAGIRKVDTVEIM
jgi:hypothetical protein